MNYETTIKIDPDVKTQLIEFSSNSGYSMSFLMKRLLKQLDDNYGKTEIAKGLIKYQRHRKAHDYDDFHYTLTDEEKNKFEMMRIKYKISISYLVLIAFLLFFQEMVNEFFGKNKNTQKNPDSYPLQIGKNVKLLLTWDVIDNKEP